MISKKKSARTAGWLYLLVALSGIFNLIYVPSTLIVSGDATATVANILSSELLFRTGILSGLVSSVFSCFWFWLYTVYLKRLATSKQF